MRVRFPTAKILELQWVRIPISVELGATFRSSRTGRMYSQIVSRLNFPNWYPDKMPEDKMPENVHGQNARK